MESVKKELIAILGLSEDCSDEELLQGVKNIVDENEMLNLAIDHSVDSFNIADGEGKFVRVNETFAHSLNLSREDMEGRFTEDLVKEGRYGPVSAVLLALKEKKRVALFQNGVNDDAIAISTPIFDDKGDIRYIVSNARFVNELKKLQRFVGETNGAEYTELLNRDHRKMIWKSTKMKEILSLVKIIATTDSSILLTGETGTGKSMLARFIHEQSSRKDGPFVEINCAAIPENLIESELFGYESGAFTGASSKGKTGLIGLADGGTLFLDEIGDMPLNLQAKLLQTLQNRTVTKVGGETEVEVDIRLITATNMDLEQLVEKGKFRSELYYRINVVPIHLPALRDRREDISIIIESALEKFGKEYDKEIMISNNAMEAMVAYSWPGNIRELENTIERLVVTNRTGVIMAEDLPLSIIASSGDSGQDIRINSILPLKDALEQVEKQLISIAYEKNSSSYSVAEMLGISQSAASRKIIKYIKKLSIIFI